MNLILSVVLTVRPLVSIFARKWVFGQHMCIMVGLITRTTGTARTMLLLALVIDRFLAVFLPFFYPKHVVKIVSILSSASWVWSVMIGILSLVFDCYAFIPMNWSCGNNEHCNKDCSFSNRITSSIGIPVIFIPVILYAILYIKARKSLSKTTALGGVASSTSHQEWKATFTFFLLFLSVFIVIFPSLVFFTISNLLYGGSDLPPFMYALNVIASSVISLLVITDPIVIMRNRDIREIFNEIKMKMAQCLCSQSKLGDVSGEMQASARSNSPHTLNSI